MTQKSPPPSMAQRIAETLPTLTRAHRKIADHVLVHPLKVATQPIDELATALEVSVATVNRFARALGFDGYPPFRAALVRDFENALAPVDKLRNQLETPATPADVFASSLNDIQRNIELTRNALDPTSCERAVDAILKAQKIRIVGFGASSWLGGLLQRGGIPARHGQLFQAGEQGRHALQFHWFPLEAGAGSCCWPPSMATVRAAVPRRSVMACGATSPCDAQNDA